MNPIRACLVVIDFLKSLQTQYSSFKNSQKLVNKFTEALKGLLDSDIELSCESRCRQLLARIDDKTLLNTRWIKNQMLPTTDGYFKQTVTYQIMNSDHIFKMRSPLSESLKLRTSAEPNFVEFKNYSEFASTSIIFVVYLVGLGLFYQDQTAKQQVLDETLRSWELGKVRQAQNTLTDTKEYFSSGLDLAMGFMGFLQLCTMCEYVTRLVYCAKSGNTWPLHRLFAIDLVSLALYCQSLVLFRQAKDEPINDSLMTSVGQNLSFNLPK